MKIIEDENYTEIIAACVKCDSEVLLSQYEADTIGGEDYTCDFCDNKDLQTLMSYRLDI